MDVHLLRSFMVVAEELHFGRAAARLVLSQPALSRQIRRLERDLGVELFDRAPAGVRLTPAGQRLRDRSRALLADLEDVAAEVTRLGGASTAVRIGCPPYARYLPVLRELEARYTTAHPDAQLDFSFGLSGKLAPRLARGDLDAAVLLVTEDVPVFLTAELLQPRLQLLVPLDHPSAEAEAIALADLRDETLVLWPRETNPELYDAILALFPDGALREVVHLPASWDLLMSAVANRVGISVVMPDLWRPDSVGVAIRPIMWLSTLGRVVLAVQRDETRPHVCDLLRLAV